MRNALKIALCPLSLLMILALLWKFTNLEIITLCFIGCMIWYPISLMILSRKENKYDKKHGRIIRNNM